MLDFINGMNVILHVVAALMFLKFWVATKDRLFLLFAIAFWIMAASRTVLAVLPHFMVASSEHTMVVYCIRLLAYVIILGAIVDKNRRSARGAVASGK